MKSLLWIRNIDLQVENIRDEDFSPAADYVGKIEGLKIVLM